MSVNLIVAATDGSEESLRAVEWAATMAPGLRVDTDRLAGRLPRRSPGADRVR